MFTIEEGKDPTIEAQQIPGWTGFNAKSNQESSVLSVVGYGPVIDASPTQYA